MPNVQRGFLAAASLEVGQKEPYFVLPTLSSTADAAERIWKRMCDDEESIARALTYDGIYEVSIIAKRRVREP